MKKIAISICMMLCVGGSAQGSKRDRPTLATDVEVKLLVTQADRAMAQYKALVDSAEKLVPNPNETLL